MFVLPKVKLVLAVISSGALVALGLYITVIKSNLATARANIVIEQSNVQKAKIALEMQSETLAETEKNHTEIIKSFDRLQTVSNAQRAQIRILNDKLTMTANGQSRDIGDIARSKPGLMTKIINNATKNANRCLEVATGATIKEKESNSECKDIIN